MVKTVAGFFRARNEAETILSALEKGRRSPAWGALTSDEKKKIAKLAIDSFRSAKVRFVLTALGMVIGTSSLILVVAISATGRQYILSEIQGIGTNLVELEYAGGGSGALGESENVNHEFQPSGRFSAPNSL